MKRVNINQSLVDKVISVFLLFLCGSIIWETKHFSEYGAYFPYIITLFLAVFSLIYFIKSWVFTLKKTHSSQKEQQELILDLPSFSASFVGVLVYIFVLFPLLGFFLGSILFCVSVTLIIQIARAEANPKLTALSFIASIVFCFAMYYIFRHLFHINLP